METFSEWLLHEMGQRNMSQQELAQKSGITAAQISRVISGQRGLGEKSLTAIAHALKISPITIFRAAGLLPEGGENASFEDWQYLLNQLPPQEQEEVRKIVEMKIERRLCRARPRPHAPLDYQRRPRHRQCISHLPL